MCGKGSCAGSSQLHSIIYTHTFSNLHSLPSQNSFCSINNSATTIADAPGLSWDCHYQPLLIGAGSLGKPVGHGRLDCHTEINPLQFPFRHYEGIPMDFGATV